MAPRLQAHPASPGSWITNEPDERTGGTDEYFTEKIVFDDYIWALIFELIKPIHEDTLKLQNTKISNLVFIFQIMIKSQLKKIT